MKSDDEIRFHENGFDPTTSGCPTPATLNKWCNDISTILVGGHRSTNAKCSNIQCNSKSMQISSKNLIKNDQINKSKERSNETSLLLTANLCV